MTIEEFYDDDEYCHDEKLWTLKNVPSGLMADAWEVMTQSKNKDVIKYQVFTLFYAIGTTEAIYLSCRFIEKCDIPDEFKTQFNLAKGWIGSSIEDLSIARWSAWEALCEKGYYPLGSAIVRLLDAARYAKKYQNNVKVVCFDAIFRLDDIEYQRDCIVQNYQNPFKE